MEKSSKVCVTGGAGYLGSWLVKKLLCKGYTVHATLRNPDDPSKAGLLMSFPGAETRLHLFRADLYDSDGYEEAIQGCDFVLHVATPWLHNTQSSKYKDISEAALAGVENILNCCSRSGTVKRFVYTGSVTASSPLKDDGLTFKDCMDESCWTPFTSVVGYDDHVLLYTASKVLCERAALDHGNKQSEFEVVSLVCGLVGGDTVLPYLPSSMDVVVSQLSSKSYPYVQLRSLQGLLGSVPLVHIEDVCDAHVFCMERPSMAGRFLCAKSYPTITEITEHFLQNHPEFHIAKEFTEGPKRGIRCGSTKLIDMGFVYKYDTEKILDDSVDCAKRLGVLKK